MAEDSVQLVCTTSPSMTSNVGTLKDKIPQKCAQDVGTLQRNPAGSQPLAQACAVPWVEWKENRKCENCGIREESVIESHHRDPTRKKHKCSQWKWWTYNGGPEALAKELAKCQALCRACHRMEHSWRSKPKSPNALFVDAKKQEISNSVDCRSTG